MCSFSVVTVSWKTSHCGGALESRGLGLGYGLGLGGLGLANPNPNQQRGRLEEHAVRVEHKRGVAPHRAVVPAARVLGRVREQAAHEGAPDGVRPREPAEIGPRSGRVRGDPEAAGLGFG